MKSNAKRVSIFTGIGSKGELMYSKSTLTHTPNLVPPGGIKKGELTVFTSGASCGGKTRLVKWVDINDLNRTSEEELIEEVDYILSSLDDSELLCY